VRNLRVVIELHGDLNLSENPAMYFLGGRLQANNNRGVIKFKEIERSCGGLLHILEGRRVALRESAELPTISLENAAGHHSKYVGNKNHITFIYRAHLKILL